MSLGGGDLQVILRRIRHGFIICDDTELCDKIISQDVETDQRRKDFAKSKSIDIEKSDLLTLLRTEPDFILDELSHSPEWTATNVQVRRVRCETLGRLDEIKTENEAKRKVQIISWQGPPATRIQDKSPDELIHSESEDAAPSSLFQRRFEPILPLVKPSPLTVLIQSTTNKQNPFVQYAKFDGTPNINPNQSKKFIVHFNKQKQKLNIVVSSHATVEETIGFVCYKYTNENREPILTQKDPSKYLLYIADDDGQAEEDFPPLTNSRPIGQFDFPHLSLIEQTSGENPSKSSFSSDSDEIPGDNYEDDDDDEGSFDDSSCPVTPSSEPIKSISPNEVVSSNATAQENPSEIDPINNLNRLYESLNQKNYFFEFYVKPGSSKHVKVRIDVSGEQIRFELLEKTSRLTWHNLPLTTQRLVDCNLLTKEINKKKDRTRFHLVFESQQESDGSRSYQIYELESTVEMAENFREQILNIIQLKNPQGREIYEQQQQQRGGTRKRRSIFNILGGSISGSGSSKS